MNVCVLARSVTFEIYEFFVAVGIWLSHIDNVLFVTATTSGGMVVIGHVSLRHVGVCDV